MRTGRMQRARRRRKSWNENQLVATAVHGAAHESSSTQRNARHTTAQRWGRVRNTTKRLEPQASSRTVRNHDKMWSDFNDQLHAIMGDVGSRRRMRITQKPNNGISTTCRKLNRGQQLRHHTSSAPEVDDLLDERVPQEPRACNGRIGTYQTNSEQKCIPSQRGQHRQRKQSNIARTGATSPEQWCTIQARSTLKQKRAPTSSQR
jgi:hypothetical protein